MTRWLSSLAGLLRSSSWTRERLLDYQSHRLRMLVRHAYDRVPYYRRLYDAAGFNPNSIRDLSDLEKIPLASRADLQALPAQQVVAHGVNPARLVVRRTSGYTGIPLSIRRTRCEEYLLQLFRLKALFELGLRPWHRRAAITWADPKAPAEEQRAFFHRKLGILRWEAVHCLLPEAEIVARLRQIRPDVIGGLAGSVARVASRLTEEDRTHIRPRFLTAGAETITAEMHRRIESGFGARLLNFYGSHEFNLLAYQFCRSGLLHINEGVMILEVHRDARIAGVGEDGEVVGTALHSFAMPFIRYRLGDLVLRGPVPCPCGAPCATLAQIQGRIVDLFPLPDGRSINPYAILVPLVQPSPWIKRYQVVQERLDFLRIRVAALTDPGPAEIEALRRRISEVLPGRVEVKVELVSDIPPEPSGKYRPFYSLVK